MTLVCFFFIFVVPWFFSHLLWPMENISNTIYTKARVSTESRSINRKPKYQEKAREQNDAFLSSKFNKINLKPTKAEKKIYGKKVQFFSVDSLMFSISLWTVWHLTFFFVCTIQCDVTKHQGAKNGVKQIEMVFERCTQSSSSSSSTKEKIP